jgi:uncharacterized protein (TIGR02466 family)
MNSNKSPDDLQINLMFPTFLGEQTYPDYASIKDQLVQRIQDIRAEDEQGRKASEQYYSNGYTSFYTLNALHHDPAFAVLTRFLHDQARQYAMKQSWDTERCKIAMSSMWCSINGRNSFHEQHLHPFSHISGVFYVSCRPDSGCIYFKDPRSARWMIPPPVSKNLPENTLIIRINPVEGVLLLFPSFMEHGVDINNTDTDRISISFNFEIQPA